MEAGDLSVSMAKYLAAARVLGLEAKFDDLLKAEMSLFDE